MQITNFLYSPRPEENERGGRHREDCEWANECLSHSRGRNELASIFVKGSAQSRPPSRSLKEAHNARAGRMCWRAQAVERVCMTSTRVHWSAHWPKKCRDGYNDDHYGDECSCFIRVSVTCGRRSVNVRDWAICYRQMYAYMQFIYFENQKMTVHVKF